MQTNIDPPQVAADSYFNTFQSVKRGSFSTDQW